jgi:peptidoglycan-associated lipoprotein
MPRPLAGKGILIFALLGLVACTTKPPVVASAPSPSMAAQPRAQTSVTSSIIPGSEQDFKVNVGDTVHFALNQYNLDPNDKQILARQSAWLERYPAVKVIVEGHCDERGTREYNLALGARRANSVKEYLMSQRIALGRIETVSYGKERPICTESNESCWSQNRRGVTTISGAAVS